jgi:response regulator of citrate/malate metabolism
MPDQDEISIALTRAQIGEVVRGEAKAKSHAFSLQATLTDLPSAARVIEATHGEGLSRSTLRSLLVLAAFPDDGSYRALVEVAKEVGYNASTTHRYLSTWIAVGLLEQDPRSRRYRRPPRSAP